MRISYTKDHHAEDIRHRPGFFVKRKPFTIFAHTAIYENSLGIWTVEKRKVINLATNVDAPAYLVVYNPIFDPSYEATFALVYGDESLIALQERWRVLPDELICLAGEIAICLRRADVEEIPISKLPQEEEPNK